MTDAHTAMVGYGLSRGLVSDATMNDLGLLDAEEPTETATRAHQEAMTAEFTPAERRLIRLQLGLGPIDDPSETS